MKIAKKAFYSSDKKNIYSVYWCYGNSSNSHSFEDEIHFIEIELIRYLQNINVDRIVIHYDWTEFCAEWIFVLVV